ncbi:hypothetical protein ACQPW3_12695 [Actinosynnema sp. CA-248983]
MRGHAHLSLRREDLAQRFPGLRDPVLAGVESDPASVDRHAP